MTGMHGLTDAQAYWLRALLETRPKRHKAAYLIRQFRMPDDVSQALTAKGLVRWVRGALEITLEGIREIARRPITEQESG